MSVSPEQLFSLLADATRLRSLLLLVREGELCVCELTHALDEIQPKVSRHLALLRRADLVADRRQGHWVYYRPHPELPGWVREVLDAALAGAREQAPYANDYAALLAMPNRPGRSVCAELARSTHDSRENSTIVPVHGQRLSLSNGRGLGWLSGW